MQIRKNSRNEKCNTFSSMEKKGEIMSNVKSGKTTKRKTKDKYANARLDESLDRRLDKVAFDDNRSRSDVIRIALRHLFKDMDAEPKKDLDRFGGAPIVAVIALVVIAAILALVASWMMR